MAGLERLAADIETLEQTSHNEALNEAHETVCASQESETGTIGTIATIATSPVTSPPLPLNWDDVDPVSLEHVCTLWPYFEISQVTVAKQTDELAANLPRETTRNKKEEQARVRRYDAWAWLEMMRRDTTGQYMHPLTGERIDVRDRAACVQACRKAHGLQNAQDVFDCSQGRSQEELAHMAQLLQPCGTSLKVKRATDRDPSSGELVRVQFYAVDPSMEINLTAVWVRPTDSSRRNTDTNITSDIHDERTDASLQEACPAWASAVNSKVATQLEIQDAAGHVLARRTLWFG